MSKEIEIPNLDHLIDRYRSGVSMKQLSNESGIGRNVLTRRFRLHGVKVRGRTEAEILKWRAIKDDPGGVERRLGRAWEASRGRPVSLETRIAQARTRQERLGNTSPQEFALASALRDRGHGLTHQFAVGPYNLDLAHRALRVAVEVEDGCSVNAWGSLRRQRMEHLLNRCWSVIIVSRRAPDPANGWTRERERLTDGTFAPEDGRSPRPDFAFGLIADKLVAFFESLRGNPAAHGQYGVIGREAHPVPVSRRYLERWTRVEGF